MKKVVPNKTPEEVEQNKFYMKFIRSDKPISKEVIDSFRNLVARIKREKRNLSK